MGPGKKNIVDLNQKNSPENISTGYPLGIPSDKKAPEVIIRFNIKGEHIFYTDNLFSFFKFRKKNLIGTSISETGYLNELSAKVESDIIKVLKSGKHHYQELSLFVNKKLFSISLSLTPELDENKQASSVICIIRDINYKNEIENQLNENIEKYKLLTSASDLGTWDWQVGSKEVIYSRKWKSQLGYYPDEIKNLFSSWMDRIHSDDSNRVKREIENFLKCTSLIFKSSYRMQHKDGSYRWFENRATVVRNSEGDAIRMFGTSRDISDEKKYMERLSILKQSFILSPSPIVITDLEGYIEFFNPAFCKVTGYSSDEIIGKKPSILKSGLHSKPFYKNLWDTIIAGNQWKGELKNKRKNGKIYWELASISCLRNEKGIITNFVKVAEDITPIKKIQDDLRKSKRISETAKLYKNNFLANMSHEIRTPVNGIIGFSELLKYADLSINQQMHYIDIIEENSRALLNLIDDIIDITKIEANELKIKKEACSLTAIFSELKETFGSIMGNQNKEKLELRFHVPRNEHHDFIFTDPFRLKQIISNLFLNALRFTHSGHIEIGYQISSDKKLQFYVEDTGTGIPAKNQKSIFKQFIQNDHSKKSKDTGAGLGLYISQGLVELLGGTIGVKSQTGKGALFFFTIPYDKIRKPPKKEPEIKPVEYDFSKYTILIAEDIDYNYEYLKEILTRTNAEILWAKDGIDTINIFNNSKIDLILMDIQLPEINGYDATKTIRKTNKEVPIIAQTAYAMSEERKKCLQAGCNDVLIKPLKIEEVLNTLALYLK